MKPIFLAFVTSILWAHSIWAADDCPVVEHQPRQVRAPLSELPAYAAYKSRLRNEAFGTRLDYHQLVFTPAELVESVGNGAFESTMTSKMPIFFIGIEKIRRQASRHVPRNTCKARDLDGARLHRSFQQTGSNTTAKKGVDAACQVLDDKRPLLLTHIAKSDGLIDGHYQKPCLLYSVYPGRQYCPDAFSDSGALNTPYDYNSAVEAVSGLQLAMDKAVEEQRPTHLLILSTGWNTQQDESLYNYIDWLSAIDRAATPGQFRPLVVAFTWQSGFDWLPRFLGVVTKGNDADEIGLTWANRVVNDAVMPVASKSGIPVVMVGHSYGTRVLGTAIFDRAVIDRSFDILGSGKVPVTFIALQPAIPIQRFSSAGKEPLYSHWKSVPILNVFTASKHDKANSMLDRYWGTYLGGEKALKIAGRFDGTSVLSLSESGEFLEPPKVGRLNLVNASSVVRCAMPGTGGAAHSDVFDDQIGRLIWSAISR